MTMERLVARFAGLRRLASGPERTFRRVGAAAIVFGGWRARPVANCDELTGQRA